MPSGHIQRRILSDHHGLKGLSVCQTDSDMPHPPESKVPYEP